MSRRVSQTDERSRRPLGDRRAAAPRERRWVFGSICLLPRTHSARRFDAAIKLAGFPTMTFHPRAWAQIEHYEILRAMRQAEADAADERRHVRQLRRDIRGLERAAYRCHVRGHGFCWLRRTVPTVGPGRLLHGAAGCRHETRDECPTMNLIASCPVKGPRRVITGQDTAAESRPERDPLARRI